MLMLVTVLPWWGEKGEEQVQYIGIAFGHGALVFLPLQIFAIGVEWL